MRTDLTAFETRQARLLSLLDQRHLPVLVVTKPANIFYLTNFRGSAGVAVFGPPDPILWVDPRYTLQARGSARGVEVREERGRLFKAVTRWLLGNEISVDEWLGKDADDVTKEEKQRLAEWLQNKSGLDIFYYEPVTRGV